MTTARKRHKYGAVKTNVDGIVFPSKKEANHYAMLKILERAGKIRELVLQPEFPIEINGILICKYRADFKYFDVHSRVYDIQDVKGFKTPVYRLKKKLVEAYYGIKILEV